MCLYIVYVWLCTFVSDVSCVYILCTSCSVCSFITAQVTCGVPPGTAPLVGPPAQNVSATEAAVPVEDVPAPAPPEQQNIIPLPGQPILPAGKTLCV